VLVANRSEYSHSSQPSTPPSLADSAYFSPFGICHWQSAVDIQQSTFSNPQSSILNPQSAIRNPQLPIGNRRSAIDIQQSAIGTDNRQSAVAIGNRQWQSATGTGNRQSPVRAIGSLQSAVCN
jgi:hypothetical protein